MGIGTFFDMLTIVAVAAWVIALAAQGWISPEQAAGALAGLVFLVAVARSERMSLPRLTFRIAMPLLAIWAIVFQYGGGNPRVQVQILANLGALMVVLFALYFMCYMPFRRRR